MNRTIKITFAKELDTCAAVSQKEIESTANIYAKIRWHAEVS